MKFLFKKFLKSKAQVSKGGAILDQVIAESAAPDNKCLLYKLANFKGGEKMYNFWVSILSLNEFSLNLEDRLYFIVKIIRKKRFERFH